MAIGKAGSRQRMPAFPVLRHSQKETSGKRHELTKLSVLKRYNADNQQVSIFD